jgi:hypothetical protein
VAPAAAAKNNLSHHITPERQRSVGAQAQQNSKFKTLVKTNALKIKD